MSGVEFPDDSTDEAFRTLEREVRQRECEHENESEVTLFGDPRRRMLCHECGRERLVEDRP